MGKLTPSLAAETEALREAYAALNPSDTPATAGAVVVEKASVALGFAKTGHDSIKATMRLSLPAGSAAGGAAAGVLFGDHAEHFTLDPKGKSPPGGATVKFTASKTGAGALVQFSVSKKDLRADLASSGLADTTTGKLGETLEVPVAVAMTINGSKYVYIGAVSVLYKAVARKSGKAKS